jgi:uncharacterized membrane protein
MKQTRNKERSYGKEAAKKSVNRRKTLLAAFVIALGIIAAVFAACGKENAVGNENTAAAVVDADLIIPLSEISASARFYPVEIDGTKLEIIAVKAPDGSVRTAFNTCQVCYDSGKGYYKQVGDTLVCQNCGNRFRMDQVEAQAGGCNPVPIFAGNKTVTDNSITVSKEFLSEAKAIFANWKSSY